MGKELDIDDVAAGHPMAQAYLSGMRAEAERLRVENATFRNAKLACEHCDPAGHDVSVAAERERCAKLVEQVADDCDEWRPLDGSRGVALRAAAVRIRGA